MEVIMDSRFLRNKDLIPQGKLDKIGIVGLGGIGSREPIPPSPTIPILSSLPCGIRSLLRKNLESIITSIIVSIVMSLRFTRIIHKEYYVYFTTTQTF